MSARWLSIACLLLCLSVAHSQSTCKPSECVAARDDVCERKHCDAVKGCVTERAGCEIGVCEGKYTPLAVDFVILVERAVPALNHTSIVRSALSRFLQAMKSAPYYTGKGPRSSAALDPRFAVLEYGKQTVSVAQDFTSDVYNVNRTIYSKVLHGATRLGASSGPEHTLAAINTVFGPRETPLLAFRSWAIKHTVIVSGGSLFANQELKPSQVTLSEDQSTELVKAVMALIQAGTSVSVCVPGTNGLFTRALGHPNNTVTYGDFSHFSSGVSSKLADLSKLSESLQGYILGQGGDARVFDLAQLHMDHLAERGLYSVPQLPFCDKCSVASPCSSVRGCSYSSKQCPSGSLCVPAAGCLEARPFKAAEKWWLTVRRGPQTVGRYLAPSEAPDVPYSLAELPTAVARDFIPVAGDRPVTMAVGVSGASSVVESAETAPASEEGSDSQSKPQPSSLEVRSAFYNLQPYNSSDGSKLGQASDWTALPTPLHTVTDLHNPSNGQYTGRWSIDNLDIKPVEVINWSPDQPWASQIIARGRPVILRNTVTSTWPALNKSVDHYWTLDYLSKAMQLEFVSDVKIGRNPKFTNSDLKSPMALHMLSINATEPFRKDTMKVEQLFENIKNFDKLSAGDERFFYYFGDMPADLKEDCPSDFLYLNPHDAALGRQFLWISSPSVTQVTHIDFDHNMFVQMMGTKVFTLFPPWDIDKLYPFPRIHPLWHKSQVDFDNPNLSVFPNYRLVKPLRAVLNPGDVLYVPPLWWHHVESVTTSVSLSTWSDGVAYLAMDAVYGYALKLDTIENKIGKIYALRLYIDLLVRALKGFYDVPAFIANIVNTRYADLAGTFEPGVEFVTEICPREGKIPTALHVQKDSQFDVMIVSGHFHKLPSEIRDLLLQDYIEEIASTVVGPHRTFAFLRYCFLGQEYAATTPDQTRMWN